MADRLPADREVKSYKANPVLWIIPIILSGIGILMITSTTSPTSFEYTGTPFRMGIKQGSWFLIAIFCTIVVYAVPVKIWYKYSGWLFALMWLLSWLPIVPGIGESIGGARRWIRLPGLGVSLQPGELLCLSVALQLAKILARDGDRDPLKSFITTAKIIGFSAIPLLMQPDLGTTILVFIVGMGMYVERIGWRYPVMAGGLLGGVALPVLILLEPYRMRRVAAFLDPWQDPLNKSFQAIQGLIAFSNGGFWGAGLGHGFQKLNYLPAAYTDFIYAAVGEELGLVGTVGILALFALWLFQVRKSYFRTGDAFRSSLIWGIALTIILPLFINVAGVTKLIPLTGMPLPFISYGGTSLVTMWSRIGLILRLEKESWAGGELLE